MRKTHIILGILLVVAGAAWAQNAPTVELLAPRAGASSCPALTGSAHEAEYCWSAANGTVNVYRASGSCPATGQPSGATPVVSNSSTLTGDYVDTAVSAATTYCAYASATGGGQTGYSANAQFTVPVFAPSGLICTASGSGAACTWTASTDSGTTVNVLEASGACGTTGQTFSAVATGQPAGGPYTLTSLSPGTYCVALTATIGGVTSASSTGFQLVVSQPAPTISVLVQ